ncbi:RNA pyrophosphohydrolase [Acrasis kona]|uniref:RNA pyrophosphohydrolase n=1 Tax=Acrasis kona TaxID=1008807 RepID=A0AAW2ZCK3_9EUKA
MEQFLDHKIVLVKGRRSMGLPKHGAISESDIDETKFRGYSFPKGHIEEGESEIEATYREVWEECGILKENLELANKVGHLVKLDKGREVHLYLFGYKKSEKDVNPPDLVPILVEEIMEAKWVTIKSVVDGDIKVKEEILKFFRQNLSAIFEEYNKYLTKIHQ